MTLLSLRWLRMTLPDDFFFLRATTLPGDKLVTPQNSQSAVWKGKKASHNYSKTDGFNGIQFQSMASIYNNQQQCECQS
jgi:hypothetical protein